MQVGFLCYGTQIRKTSAPFPQSVLLLPSIAAKQRQRSQHYSLENNLSAHRTYVMQDLSSREPPDDSKVQVTQHCLHKLLQFHKNGAGSSAVSEMLIFTTSWSLIIEKHSLPSREEGPSSCNANRLNCCSCTSNSHCFSTELCTECTKQLIFFFI